MSCWGYNGYGELGNGTTTDSSVPVTVSGMQSHVTSISGNYYITCAVQLGAAKCWGYNSDGAIGDGTTTDRHHARQVVGLTSGVVRISVNWYGTCALLDTAGVRCWGDNTYGSLGNGTTTSSLVPVKVHLIPA
jgi:alpha-tubulin suppressor-like RCC1 family protein